MTTARSRTAARRLALTAPMVTGFKVLIGNGGLSSLLAHSFYFFSRTYICIDLALLSHVSGVWVDGQADRWIYLVAWTSNIGSQTHAIYDHVPRSRNSCDMWSLHMRFLPYYFGSMHTPEC